MGLALALILGLGSFGGYTAIQSGAADAALNYEKQPIVRVHKPIGATVVQYIKTDVHRHNKPWGVK